jgi:tryptophanyl-tRNA synthetase
MVKKRLVSGMRTTGSLHLGHLEGTLKNWVELQDEYECFFFAAVWHAFTDRLKIENLAQITREMVVDWLSVGIDPDKSVIFRQSAMHEHAELCTILSNMTPLGWLERCPTFKDEVRDNKARSGVSLGKLMYPVLQTADIAAYNGEVVPVGKDQLPHLELSREIVRRFNTHAGKVLVEPQPKLSPVPMLLGIDKRKMSKSYDNGIYLRETPESLKKKIQMMVTDPQRVRRNDPGDPEVCTVYSYHKIYNPDRLEEIASGCRNAGIGCRDCKQILFDSLDSMLEGYRQKRAEIEAKEGYVEEVLAEGEKKAHQIAGQTMQKVRQAMGFLF